MHAHINAVQAPHRSSTHTPGWVLPVRVAWLAREHSQWERYRHARRQNASLTDEDGMKATLAESTIKSAEGLEKGAREPTSQTVKPRAAPRRSEIRPLHMPRESKWYTIVILDRSSGVWIANIFDIHVESFGRVLQRAPTCYTLRWGSECCDERTLNKGGMYTFIWTLRSKRVVTFERWRTFDTPVRVKGN